MRQAPTDRPFSQTVEVTLPKASAVPGGTARPRADCCTGPAQRRRIVGAELAGSVAGNGLRGRVGAEPDERLHDLQVAEQRGHVQRPTALVLERESRGRAHHDGVGSVEERGSVHRRQPVDVHPFGQAGVGGQQPFDAGPVRPHARGDELVGRVEPARGGTGRDEQVRHLRIAVDHREVVRGVAGFGAVAGGVDVDADGLCVTQDQPDAVDQVRPGGVHQRALHEPGRGGQDRAPTLTRKTRFG